MLRSMSTFRSLCPYFFLPRRGPCRDSLNRNKLSLVVVINFIVITSLSLAAVSVLRLFCRHTILPSFPRVPLPPSCCLSRPVRPKFLCATVSQSSLSCHKGRAEVGRKRAENWKMKDEGQPTALGH